MTFIPYRYARNYKLSQKVQTFLPVIKIIFSIMSSLNNILNTSSTSDNNNVKIKGQWDENRERVLMESMNNNRPYNQKYTKKTDAWNHVSADVNAASPSLPALGLSAIRKKVESLRKDYREKQRADRSATGTNDSETQLDELIRTFDEMVKKIV